MAPVAAARPSRRSPREAPLAGIGTYCLVPSPRGFGDRLDQRRVAVEVGYPATGCRLGSSPCGSGGGGTDAESGASAVTGAEEVVNFNSPCRLLRDARRRPRRYARPIYWSTPRGSRPPHRRNVRIVDLRSPTMAMAISPTRCGSTVTGFATPRRRRPSFRRRRSRGVDGRGWGSRTTRA